MIHFATEDHPIVLENIKFPDPVIGMAIEPKTQADVDKLGMSLGKLAEEDPTFRVKWMKKQARPLSGYGRATLGNYC